ncbi:MAG: hypothetical protein ABIT08_15385 [Bacteroidia bacterium]
MKSVFKIASFVLLVASFNSCTYDENDIVYPSVMNNTMMPVDTDSMGNVIVISYMNAIKPIMTTYCFGLGNQHCHVTVTNQGAIGDFTTYAGLKAKVDNGSIASRVINPAGGMPPTYTTGPMPVSATDKMKIQSWIDNGAPNN